MQLHDLTPAPGSTKNRKRVGRGNSSGHGTTSGRGQKGQGSRSGGTKVPCRWRQGCRLRGWPDSAGYAPAQASGLPQPPSYRVHRC